MRNYTGILFFIFLSNVDRFIGTCGTSLDPPLDISKVLNSHFTQIGPNLENNVPKTNYTFEQYITPAEHCFSLNETNSTMVYKLMEYHVGY